MHNKPIALIILDGFGISSEYTGNAVAQAQTPYLTSWLQTMPHTTLAASGTAVGLPKDYVGNSEVGHYTIGAGCVVMQSITLINEQIKSGLLNTNPILTQAFKDCANTHKKCHIIGILSDAGIHGNQDHIIAYARAAHEQGVHKIFVHAIIDGRDTQMHTAQKRLEDLASALKPYHAEIVTIHGRFYAMDRNKNYDRTLKSYLILTDPLVPLTQQWQSLLYPHNSSEEYCEPMRIHKEGFIESEDTVVFTACRADRIRQLVQALAGKQTIVGKHHVVQGLIMLSPISYGPHIPTQPLYETTQIHNTLKEVLCAAHRTVFSIAESEKYAHVTYFFNGERENVFSGEVRHLIPSHSTRASIEFPALKAVEITDTVIKSLSKDPKDFYLINYANADIVGHSANLAATRAAIEVLDNELGRLFHILVEEMDGILFITADHGNAEEKINLKTGNPSPTHTTNPVPFIIVSKKPLPHSLIADMESLADIAPLILSFMHITVPSEMIGSRSA